MKEKTAWAICFTKSGWTRLGEVDQVLKSLGWNCRLHYKGRFNPEIGSNINVVDQKLRSWTEEAFSTAQVIVFVGAVGIAVRAIAPFIEGKDVDPAVISMDDGGKFVIPILSGHIGGSNGIAEEMGRAMGSIPVITTASDNLGRVAVDSWAKEQNLHIDSLEDAREIASAIVAGEGVGFVSKVETVGALPKEFLGGMECERGINISDGRKIGHERAFPVELKLIPRRYVLGIGCKRNTDIKKIEELVFEKLDEQNIDDRAIFAVATIDLKKDEIGLIEFCKSLNVEMHTFTGEELMKVQGDFPQSDFVKSVTGVDNVCDRAAMMMADERIMKKTSREGVTLAIYSRRIKVEMPGAGEDRSLYKQGGDIC